MIRPVNGEAGGRSSTIKSSSNCLKESPSFNDDGAMGSMFSHRIENRQQFAYASGQCNLDDLLGLEPQVGSGHVPALS